MATENIDVIHTDKFTQGVSLNRVCECFGKNVTCLIVGSDVADVNARRSTNFSKPV